MGLCIGLVCVGSRSGFLLTLSRKDRATAQHKQYVHNKNCGGGGMEQLKCIRYKNCFSDCYVQNTKVLVGFADGATEVLALKPTELVMNSFALIGRLQLLC